MSTCACGQPAVFVLPRGGPNPDPVFCEVCVRRVSVPGSLPVRIDDLENYPMIEVTE